MQNSLEVPGLASGALGSKWRADVLAIEHTCCLFHGFRSREASGYKSSHLGAQCLSEGASPEDL